MTKLKGSFKPFFILWGSLLLTPCISLMDSISTAHAEGYPAYFSTRTYLGLYKDMYENQYAPLYEYFEAEYSRPSNGVKFYSAGWLKYDFRTSREKRANSDVDHAFVTYSPPSDSDLVFNAGRHYVFEGIASEQIDGFSARWNFTRDTGLSFYGGIPVEADNDGRVSDAIYGGRLFGRISGKAEAGLSFLIENNSGIRYREEIGLDLWAIPFRGIEIQGISIYNAITDGFIEHSYSAKTVLHGKINLRGFFVHTNYRDAFSSATLSVFSPDNAGLDGKMTKTGVSAEYPVSGTISAALNYTGYTYQASGDARHYGARLNYKVTDIHAGGSFSRMEGETARLRYTELRLYTVKRVERQTYSLDFITLRYDRPYNNMNSAYNMNGTAEYAVNNNLSASLSIDRGRDPDYSHFTRVMLSLVYTFKDALEAHSGNR